MLFTRAILHIMEWTPLGKLTKRAWVRSVVLVLACALPVWCCGYHLRNWWRRGVLSLSPCCPYHVFPSHIWQLYHGNAIISCASDWFNGVLLDCNGVGLVALILQDLIRQISCGLVVLIYPSRLHVLVIWSQNRLAYVIVWRIVDLCLFLERLPDIPPSYYDLIKSAFSYGRRLLTHSILSA